MLSMRAPRYCIQSGAAKKSMSCRWVNAPMAAAMVQIVLLSLLSSAVLSPVFAVSTCGSRTEVYYLSDGQDYRGVVNTTVSGLPCQMWSRQTPHAHEIPLDPATGIGAHNYCRNANGLERPGCFADAPDAGYEFCDIGDVCTADPASKPTVFFTPVSGTKLVADGSHNYVRLRCSPRPCSVHYTLGDESSVSASSPVYGEPILLDGSTTVKMYVRYENAAPLRAQARYVVLPTTTPAPPQSLHFIPTDAVPYDSPILVALEGVTTSDQVLLYWGDDVMHPTPYTAGTSVRLRNSTVLLAVVNGTYLVTANYTLHFTVPPLYVYPASGTFVGGVRMIVRDPQPPSTYYMYVNRSTEWQALPSTQNLPWMAIGTSELDIRALHVRGVESAETVVYEVLPATPPIISPDPSFVYHRPINVTCVAPHSTPLAFAVYVDTAMQNPLAERVYAMPLRTPGNFTVVCTYLDDLQESHTTTAVLQLVAVALEPPTFIPPCKSNFPAIGLSLQTKLNVSRLPLGATAFSWSVTASATGGAYIPMITRHPEADDIFIYDIFQRKRIETPTTMVVYMTAHSTDPLESDSPPSTCSYSLYPLGSVATPVFAVLPYCATPTAPVGEACMTVLRQHLASCMYFYDTELLSMVPLGPFLEMRVTGLVSKIREDMYTRIGACLADMEVRGILTGLHNETAGGIVLATSWQVERPTYRASQVYTDLPLTVRVTGYHVDTGAYHLVRSDYSCEDVGVTPETVSAAVSQVSPASGSSSMPDDWDGDSSLLLTFHIPVAGEYKLCTYINDALYVVPFHSLSVAGGEAASITRYLDVAVQPWPAVEATPAEECGGLIPPDMEGHTFSFSMSAIPSGAYPSLAYAYNSAGWETRMFPTDANTQLTGPVSLPVGPLSRYARRSLEVIDTAVGEATSGAAKTCIFFVSAASAPAPRSPISYFFYTVNRSVVTASSRGVMLLLQGTFSPDELIVIDVYENVSSTSQGGATSTPSLQLIRRVMARSSAATAYTIALPDAVLSLPAGPERSPFTIFATLDGGQATVVPSVVALSPLALAMTPCTFCTSGLCYEGTCICKNKRTKVMSVCGTDPGADSSDSSASDITTTTTSGPEPTGSDSGDGDDETKTSLRQRLSFLFAYAGLLTLIAAYILFSVRRGGKRRERVAPAADVTVETS